MCDYTGRDFGAPYPDAACHNGYLWDLDGDGWVDGDFDQPCPRCNTAEYLDGAKDDAESTEQGSDMAIIYSGAMIIEGAVRKARRENPDGTAAWCLENPRVSTFDWPDRDAVLRGEVSPKSCPQKTLQTASM